MFKCEIKVKNNFKGIKKIQDNLPKVVKESVEDVLKNLQTTAIRLENGHNSQGILVELVDTSTMKVKGKVYADPNLFMSNGQSYLWFEYFGTGGYAEMEHVGKTEHFIESGYTEWYIPVSKVGRTLSYPIVTLGNKEYYVATGAESNHFLGDAEFKTRNENVEIVKKKIEKMFKEVCK